MSKITGQMATTKKNHKRKKLFFAKLYQEPESGTTALEKKGTEAMHATEPDH